MIKHYNITVSGKVQGVGFRFRTANKAIMLKIRGFVQNKTDKSVYIEAEGEEENINKFLNWCKEGSPLSNVENVVCVESPLKHFETFKIIRTLKNA